MGRVIAGVLIGCFIGGIVGNLPTFNDAGIQIQMSHPGGVTQQHISLARFLHYISWIVGVGCGGIIGAIAGATSANPHSKPLGVWLWIFLGVLLIVLLLGLAAYWLMPMGAAPVDHRPIEPQPMDVRKPGPQQGQLHNGSHKKTIVRQVMVDPAAASLLAARARLDAGQMMPKLRSAASAVCFKPWRLRCPGDT